ncbi:MULTISPECIES: hypothetical protein [unclassified Streptomyces]|nr:MULTISPECIES: hypothetical protein [unclassified Streptomyces]AEN09578.1 hypothetical protein SACTE_1663 [Streptomyces sp. SirexAA-E]PZX45069.1 hypothetical protein K373_00413 [Streptomyces sp. DvalAA-21]RAJ32729.1 hypothetical protein K351_04042 [Streptomyces sp. DpondAA-E10]RAJ47690.1 hypothetical protein K352_03437 [Streptomyces sp. DpondAA-A50]SCE54075.1 hypothetical protein GA0115235_124046 [Streptomyces sp. DpondAA-F4a]
MLTRIIATDTLCTLYFVEEMRARPGRAGRRREHGALRATRNEAA